MDRDNTSVALDPIPPQRTPARVGLVLLLLVLCLGFRFISLAVMFDSKETFFTGPLTDDSFYSLGIARNLAAGNGFTFDRIHETNGFQPLYVFLMVPVYAYFSDDPIKPVQAAVLMLLLANTAAGFLLWRILRREVGNHAALFALLLFSVSPYVIDGGMNGLETSLALLFFLAAYDLYLARLRPGTDLRRHRIGLAILFALLVFARVDGALLAAAIAADYVLHRAPLPFRQRSLKMARIAGIAVAIYSPWLIFNLAHFGSLLPQSGGAIRLMSQLYGEMELPIRIRAFAPGDIPAAFYAGHFIQSLTVLGNAGLFFPVGPLVLLLQMIGQLTGVWVIGSWIVCAPVFLAGCIVAFRARRSLGAAFWAVGLTIAAYSLYTFGAWFFFRYFYVIGICLLMIGAALFDRVATNRRWVTGITAAVYVLVVCYGFVLRSQPNDFQLFNYELIKQALDYKAPGVPRVGSFQTGYVGYFSPERQVVNLDGVVNPAAYAAMRENQLYQYLVSERIEYIADYKNITDRLLLPRLGVPPSRALIPLSNPEDAIQIFKVKL